MNEENVVADNSNTAEEVQPNETENTETTVEETQEESIDDVKAELAKAKELVNSYRVRAEKAEKKAKESTTVETKVTGELSSKDIIALTRAGISDEDLDEVLDFAKYKKIPIAEALKNKTLKTLLKDNEEQRKTASASNTSTARRGSVKVSDDTLVSQMEKGEVPEDPSLLAQARMNLKKKK